METNNPARVKFRKFSMSVSYHESPILSLYMQETPLVESKEYGKDNKALDISDRKNFHCKKINKWQPWKDPCLL